VEEEEEMKVEVEVEEEDGMEVEENMEVLWGRRGRRGKI